MAHTQRFTVTMLPPQPTQMVLTCDIMSHLIGPEPKGPISAFDVFRRAAELKGRVNEAHLACCVQVVLVSYGWLEGEISTETAHRDLRRALGEKQG